MTPPQRTAHLAALNIDDLQRVINRDWTVIARPEQLAAWDIEWRWCLWMAGRFFGKTRAGAEATRERVSWLSAQTGGAPFQFGLVSRRLKDVRNVMMEGPSGLRSIIPPSMLIDGSWTRSFNRGAVELKLASGAEIRGFSSEAPDDITGSGLAGAWVDEVASLRDAKAGRYQMGTFYHLDAALREGPDPRGLLTGTPRNNRLIRELVADDRVRVVKGSTYDNLANAPASYREFVEQYRGTRLGRQELDGELLGDVGAMFSRADLIDDDRLVDAPPTGDHLRRARAWDLASTQAGDSNPDPDWSVGAKLSVDPRTRIWTIEHVVRVRVRPGERDDLIRSTAISDGLRYQHVEKVGSWGNDLMDTLGRHLDGICRVKGLPATGTKAERADPLAAAAEQGRLRIVRGPWLDALVDEFEEFPDGDHDDIVDACAMAMRAVGERREVADPVAGQAQQRQARLAGQARAGARITSAR